MYIIPYIVHISLLGLHTFICDQPMLVDMYTPFFQRSGFQANYFTDPLQSLEFYKENAKKYSLVMTDLSIPGIPAIDFANQIRNLNSNVKILLITSWDINNTYTNETKIE